MNVLTETLKAELTRLDQEIAALQSRRSKVAELLAPVVLSEGKAAPAKRASRSAAIAAKNASEKPKGWPKGMPRDPQKRSEWFATEEGKAYLRANPGSKATTGQSTGVG